MRQDKCTGRQAGRAIHNRFAVRRGPGDEQESEIIPVTIGGSRAPPVMHMSKNRHKNMESISGPSFLIMNASRK